MIHLKEQIVNKAKLRRTKQINDFGKFVIIPAEQVNANRSKAYDYIF